MESNPRVKTTFKVLWRNGKLKIRNNYENFVGCFRVSNGLDLHSVPKVIIPDRNTIQTSSARIKHA